MTYYDYVPFYFYHKLIKYTAVLTYLHIILPTCYFLQAKILLEDKN